MSKYTTELRYICEQFAGLDESVGYNDIDEVIEGSRDKIFDFPYPIFDNEYKPGLEKKIIEHYYTREISEETVGLWKLRLRAKMNEIMPYYNKLYESELLEFNPLYTHDITVDGESHSKNERDLTEKSDNTNTASGSDVTRITGSDVNSHGGSNTLEIEGGETDTLSGSDTATLGGSDVLSKTKGETVQTSGSDVTRLSGSDVSTQGGSDETSMGGSDTLSKDNKHNDWDLYSDTPQGGIWGIHDAEAFTPQDIALIPDPTVEGNGYLTNARHTFGDTSGSEETTDYGRTETTDYGKTDTTQYGKTETITHGKSEQLSGTGSETTQYGKTNTTQYGKVDSKEREETRTQSFGKTETMEYGKIDTATYGKINTFDGTIRTAGTVDDNGDYLEHIYGWRGYNPSRSLQDWRQTFLNIDMMVIEELKDLFFLLW